MDIKNAIGIANVLAIFSDLSEEAKQSVLSELNIKKWIDAAKNKPEPYIPVFAKGGFQQEPLPRMVVWTGEKWMYYDVYAEVESISHFLIP